MNAESDIPKARSRAGTIVSWGVGLLLPAATAWVLLRDDGSGRLAEVFASASPAAFILPVCIYAVLSLVKAMRWSVILGGGLRRRDYYSASSVHNLFALVIPMGLGEFAFVWIFSSRHGLPAGKGLVGLGIGRAYDTAVLLCLSGGVAASLFGMWPLSIVAVGAVVALGVLGGPMSRRSAAVTKWLGTRLEASGVGVLSKGAAACSHMTEALTRGFPSWRVLVLTLSCQILIAGLMAALVTTFAPELDTGTAVLAAFLVPLGALVPIRGLGDFGKFEAVWAGALAIGGVEPARGAAVGFAIHVVVLVFASASAGIGWLLGRLGAAHRFDTRAVADTIAPDDTDGN